MSHPASGLGTPPQQSGIEGISSGGHGTPLPGDVLEPKPAIETLTAMQHSQVLHPDQLITHNPHAHTPPQQSLHQIHSHLPPHSMIMSTLHDPHSIAHLGPNPALAAQYTIAGSAHAGVHVPPPQHQDLQYSQHPAQVNHHLSSVPAHPQPPVTMHENMMDPNNLQTPAVEIGT